MPQVSKLVGFEVNRCSFEVSRYQFSNLTWQSWFGHDTPSATSSIADCAKAFWVSPAVGGIQYAWKTTKKLEMLAISWDVLTAVCGLWRRTLRVKQFFSQSKRHRSLRSLLQDFPRESCFKIHLPNPAGSPVPLCQGWNWMELHGFIDWVSLLPIQEETKGMP